MKTPHPGDRVRRFCLEQLSCRPREVLFVGWVELAKPMLPLVMGIASLNPSYEGCRRHGVSTRAIPL
jgi:hypothetical protein